MGLGQGLLVAHPPSRAILKVGHAGDEAVVLLAPEYLYCVSIIRFSHRATSFAQTPVGCSYLYQYPEIQEKARAKRRKPASHPTITTHPPPPFSFGAPVHLTTCRGQLCFRGPPRVFKPQREGKRKMIGGP